MMRKKQRSERSIKGGYDDNCVSGLDLVEEDHKECPLVSEQGKVMKANKDYAVGKLPETTAGPRGYCSVDAGMTDRRKELQGVVKLGRMWETRVSPADTSVSKTCEYQRDSTSKDDAGSCSGENSGMIRGRQRDSNGEECFKEAQDGKLKQPFSQLGKPIVHMTMGDATKLTFSKSTPYSGKVQHQGDIDADVQEQGYSSAKKDTANPELWVNPETSKIC